MATSDDERREVAAAMRAISCRGVENLTLGEVLNSILTGGAPRPTTEMAALARLADLIDPTCEVDYRRYLYGCCAYEYHLSCGHSVDRPWRTPPAYCPECGARCIAGEGDGDED
jgi:hypothetical protein